MTRLRLTAKLACTAGAEFTKLQEPSTLSYHTVAQLTVTSAHHGVIMSKAPCMPPSSGCLSHAALHNPPQLLPCLWLFPVLLTFPVTAHGMRMPFQLLLLVQDTCCPKPTYMPLDQDTDDVIQVCSQSGSGHYKATTAPSCHHACAFLKSLHMPSSCLSTVSGAHSMLCFRLPLTHYDT
jgi:hypothetical protein